MKNFLFLLLPLLAFGFLSCDDDELVDDDSNESGLTIKSRTESFAQIYDDVKSKVTGNGFTVIAEVDHQAAAAGVGVDLLPTSVIIFGNPEGGTRLMQEDQRIGIDLPLKMLVWEDENGDVWLGYYPASYLADRHDIEDRGEVVDMINTALNDLSDAALN